MSAWERVPVSASPLTHFFFTPRAVAHAALVRQLPGVGVRIPWVIGGGGVRLVGVHLRSRSNSLGVRVACSGGPGSQQNLKWQEIFAGGTLGSLDCTFPQHLCNPPGFHKKLVGGFGRGKVPPPSVHK